MIDRATFLRYVVNARRLGCPALLVWERWNAAADRLDQGIEYVYSEAESESSHAWTVRFPSCPTRVILVRVPVNPDRYQQLANELFYDLDTRAGRVPGAFDIY